jgi:hypothetical protein
MLAGITAKIFEVFNQNFGRAFAYAKTKRKFQYFMTYRGANSSPREWFLKM